MVFQQASVISANCDAVVQQMCGQMDVDNWSEKKWRIIFEESDVCVMTAQIFLDTLRHGFIHMDEVCMLRSRLWRMKMIIYFIYLYLFSGQPAYL